MSAPIRFVLDGTVHEVRGLDPTLTVLDYLRYHLRRTGTKEGCAEGDCGACTVVLGELESGRVRYRAVNACILFLPVLDGKELITVESLSPPDGPLHPVQAAMVEADASQCGFCTPGFVMSLAAHDLAGGERDARTIANVLAGNLCRCTGYGPILTAAQSYAQMSAEVRAAREAASRAALAPLQRKDTFVYEGPDPVDGTRKSFFAPRSEAALAALLAEYREATILAGSTDIGLWVTKQHRCLDSVIYVGAIASLKRIEKSDRELTIGAGVHYSDVMGLLAELSADIGEMIRRLGSVQIRNAGTLGGNIANGSPIGDSRPALIAAGAELVLRRRDGERRMPLEDYFLAYGVQDRQAGEYVAEIRVPLPQAGEVVRGYKISKRFDQDISAVCGFFKFSIEDNIIKEARLAFGGLAGTPKRASKAEAALVGKRLDVSAIRTAMDALARDFTPLTDMRASARYRLTVAQNLLYKAYLETSGAGAPARLAEVAGV